MKKQSLSPSLSSIFSPGAESAVLRAIRTSYCARARFGSDDRDWIGWGAVHGENLAPLSLCICTAHNGRFDTQIHDHCVHKYYSALHYDYEDIKN